MPGLNDWLLELVASIDVVIKKIFSKKEQQFTKLRTFYDIKRLNGVRLKNLEFNIKTYLIVSNNEVANVTK